MQRRDFLVGTSATLSSLALGCGGPIGVDEPTASAASIEVVDLMPELFAFWDAHEALPDAELAARFLDTIVAAHPELYVSSVIGGAGVGDAGFEERVTAWMGWLRDVQPTMRSLHRAFSEDLDASRARFVDALPDFDWQGNVYLFASIEARSTRRPHGPRVTARC
ncbi:MAG: hypothetical protein H6719_35925 [Sandaracinaceae bacterium]|nr:hypothetical protein [Sandaracinaceae bacterium]